MSATSEPTTPTPNPGPTARARRDREPERGGGPRLGAVIAIVLAVGVGAWLLLRDGDDDSGSASLPEAATTAEIRDFAAGKDFPVYWAGSRPRFTYELTETGMGNVFIRYLPPGVSVGDKRPNFLTVGTYPYENAYATLEKLGARDGSSVVRIAGGGIAVVSGRNPKSVYIAFPKQDYQVEVYDPSPSRALRLATSGRLRPVP